MMADEREPDRFCLVAHLSSSSLFIHPSLSQFFLKCPCSCSLLVFLQNNSLFLFQISSSPLLYTALCFLLSLSKIIHSSLSDVSLIFAYIIFLHSTRTCLLLSLNHTTLPNVCGHLIPKQGTLTYCYNSSLSSGKVVPDKLPLFRTLVKQTLA